jgi:hypothetical protein
MCCCIPQHYTKKERCLVGCIITWAIFVVVFVGLAFGLSIFIQYLIESHVYDAALLDSQVRSNRITTPRYRYYFTSLFFIIDPQIALRFFMCVCCVQELDFCSKNGIFCFIFLASIPVLHAISNHSV